MTTGEIANKTQFPVYNGMAPASGGPKAIPMTLDFSVNAAIEFNLIDEVARDIISFVQSVWVDNSDNPNPLIFIFSQTGQRLKIPAYAEGIWPVIAPAGLRCVVTTTPGVGVICNAIFLNVPMPMTQFGPVTVNANVTATFTPVAVTVADYSTATTANTSTELFAANANAKSRVVQNPGNNAESIWINFQNVAAGNAGTSIEIPPGGEYATGNTIDQSQWNVYAVNAIKYVAKEGV